MKHGQRIAWESEDRSDIDTAGVLELPAGTLELPFDPRTGQCVLYFTRADIENGTTTRHTVGGMPAILDTFDALSPRHDAPQTLDDVRSAAEQLNGDGMAGITLATAR